MGKISYYFLLIVQLWLFAMTSSEEEITHTDDILDPEEEEEIEPFYSLLFPSFSVTVGIVTFWLLSRYARVLPYTAVMFLIGTLMGLAVELNSSQNHHLHQSLSLFVNIDSEVLLLVFLPGLIFKDAFSQNVHLFAIALGQCTIFAFPMVLAGTSLTACICYYILPYGWGFNLCMTVGAILSATDPVAVAALLEQVGAPPRLKVHIAGEALLNDGSAIVFFSIFIDRYLYDIGISDHEVGLAEGFKLFFRKSLGAVAIGLFFACGLLTISYMLGKRFNREENVVEVSATIAVAYLNYYTADAVWETSGVLATVALGVTVKFFGRPMLNDSKLLEDFWSLVEHLLNTVIFTLGGAVWGSIVAKGEKDGVFTVRDYAYVLLLYILLAVLRAGLFCATYPVTKRIGLKTNWPETLFQIYSGLRGAVGIALAIALDNDVRKQSESPADKEDTLRVFFFVGGIAFLTLVINGTTAGPLLKKLGLADSTETREKIVAAYETRFVAASIDDMVRLLTQPRFQDVNFALVKHHVPYLRKITRSQLMEAVEKHRDTTRPEEYFPPKLQKILPYLKKEDDPDLEVTTRTALRSAMSEEADKMEFDPEAYARKVQRVLRTKHRMRRRTYSSMRMMMQAGGGEDPLSLQELRSLYISLLKSAYEKQVVDGELDARGFLPVALQASLDFAGDAIQRGETLQDWKYVRIVDSPIAWVAKMMKSKAAVKHVMETAHGGVLTTRAMAKDSIRRLDIERVLSFMAAHRYAQQFMQKQFENTNHELSELEKTVFNESQMQYRNAQTVLESYPSDEVQRVVSHKFCLILLNSSVAFISELLEHGLLKDQEAEHLVEEIEKDIEHVLSCDELKHPGELEDNDDSMQEVNRIVEETEADLNP